MAQRLVLLVALLLGAGSAYAGSYTLNFQGFQQGGWQEGYPYFGNINGGPTIYIMCDDYAHGGVPGQTWQVNFTNLGSNDLTFVRFNQLSGAPTLYDEAGWILLQTLSTPMSEWTDMNGAVWHIFDSGAPLDQGAQNWLNLAQLAAANNFPNTDFHNVGIYTPVDQYDSDLNDPQEMLAVMPSDPPGNIPEPATLVLLSTGLAGLVARKLLS